MGEIQNDTRTDYERIRDEYDDNIDHAQKVANDLVICRCHAVGIEYDDFVKMYNQELGVKTRQSVN